MTRDEFKKAVIASLERRGCTKIKVDLSIMGLQGEAKFKEEGFPSKREAHVWLKDKDTNPYLWFETEDGMNWKDEV